MKWKTFCQLKALITLAFGLLVLLVPAFTWGLFGFDVTDHVTLLSRLIGIVYVAMGVMFYNMHSLDPSASRRQTAVIVGTADLASALLFVIATVTSVTNPLAWLLVVSFGLFSVLWFVLG